MTTRIAIAGASGYAGGEVARLVGAHPHCELGALTAHRNEGRDVSDVHPHLSSLRGRTFGATDVATLAQHDVVVLALPHGESGTLGDALAAANPDLVLVDLGADRRLVSATDWAAYYGGEHRKPWTYGIPELPLADGGSQRRELAGARRIAAPGCNASAVSIALAPLVRDELVDLGDIVATLAVGSSGAGRVLREDLLASERFSSAQAYAIAGTHRHTPEILQTLGMAGADLSQVKLSLTPILVPMSRGILAVVTASVPAGVDEGDLYRSLQTAYANEQFIGVSQGAPLPSTGAVQGSNRVQLSVALDQATRRVTVLSALDNLVKGTAGAAIQSLNVALGFDEAAGLSTDGVAP